MKNILKLNFKKKKHESDGVLLCKLKNQNTEYSRAQLTYGACSIPIGLLGIHGKRGSSKFSGL